MQPTTPLGELNRAMELTSVDGRTISDLDIRSMLVDDTGTLWLAVAEPVEEGVPKAAWLFSYNGDVWRTLETPYLVRRGVLAGSEDVLWVDTFEGIARFDGGSWEQYTPDDGIPRSISSASIGADGKLWVYSTGVYEAPTVAMFDGEEWLRWEALTGDLHPGFIATAPDGSVWVVSADARWGEGEPGGLWTLENGEWLQAWEPTKPLDFFSAHAVGGDGELWAAYREYVLHLSGGEAQLYDATDGVGNVPGQGAAIGWTPTDIEIANDETWIATLGGGLSRFNGADWQTFGDNKGLPSPLVTKVELGPDGTLWLRVGEDGERIIAYDADR
jgi:hypothetical protein